MPNDLLSVAALNPDAIIRSLSIQERKRLLDVDKKGEHSAPSAPDWEPFKKHPHLFADRLRAAGIGSELDYVRLCNPSVTELRSRPDWVEEHDTLCRTKVGAESWMSLEAPFIRYLRPLVEKGLSDIEAAVTRSDAGTWISHRPAADLFLGGLNGQLYQIVRRTLILELNVARLRGELVGSSSEERFHAFEQLLSDESYQKSLFDEYPLIYRLASSTICNWRDAAVELIERLHQDWDDLTKTGLIPPGVSLESIALGSGDLHARGRSVAILSLSGGGRLVYKPRDLSVYSEFQSLLAGVGDLGFSCPYRTVNVAARGPYGWTEFIGHSACTDSDQLDRFYRRQGGYVALLHALRGVDMHFENVIAAGEYPVLVDLEGLFHPPTDLLIPDDISAPAQEAFREVRESVLRTGLLPMQTFDPRADMSGMGGRGGQLTPYEVLVEEGVRKEDMRLERKAVQMADRANQPVPVQTAPPLLAHREEVERGFREMYELLATHREQFTKAGGFLDRFRGLKVRVIPRPTSLYARLLGESLHPDLMRDASDRDRLFDSLWAGAHERPWLSRVIEAEREELFRGDIPSFHAFVGSRDIVQTDGTVIEDFVETSVLGDARERLSALTSDEVERQLWYVRASISGSDAVLHVRKSRTSSEHASPATKAETLSPIEIAESIGDRLLDTAKTGDRRATWVGITMVDEARWMCMPVGFDCYSGNAGIALYLGYLSAETQEARYREMALMALDEAFEVAMSDEIQNAGSRYAVFTGPAGVAYSMLHVQQLFDGVRLWPRIDAIVAGLVDTIKDDEELDVLGGSAGFLLLSLALLQASGRGDYEEAARVTAAHLLRAQREDGSWSSPLATDDAGGGLTGFAHGAAGIAYSLVTAGTALGDDSYIAAGLRGFGWEEGLFDEATGNWPDLRAGIPQSTGGAMNAFCHGSAGIALARAACPSDLLPPESSHVLSRALDAVAVAGFAGSQCLCHGALGNAEPFLARHGSEHSVVARALHEARIAGLEFRCGTPAGLEVPGLMTGIAGIGYGLLRLTRPDRIPSVLTLEGPIET